MEERNRMRAADADRDATAERLRAALNEGRLDLHGGRRRLRRAYGSKTYGELDELLTDLPGTGPAGRPCRRLARPGRAGWRSRAPRP
ncbi:DUF1707 domain-containing protein [Micromonospora sp. BRA006-A]|nr:DUF1707 domain-containing protein [Micromonospora sp. BRA006-A]